MLSSLGSQYENRLRMDNAVVDLYSNPTELDSLCSLGVDYMYSGNKAPFTQDDFDFSILLSLPGTKLVYDLEGVQVLKICDD
jgi:hypothetical protein